MNSIGAPLVWCIIQVTLLAGLAALLCGLARRSGPPLRALAAFAGLILIAGLTLLAFSPWPRWETGIRPVAAQSDQSPVIGSAGETAIDDGGEPSQAEAPGSPLKSTKPADALSPSTEFFKTLVAEMRHLPASAENRAWRWPAYVAALLFLSAGVGLVRLVAGLAAVRSYRHQSRPITEPNLLETVDVLLAELCCPKAVALCESELLATPATIGWQRPLIILPADWRNWTDDECRAVLAHEIAHIARHDFPTWVAAQAALVFHFYHPLVHWLAARLRLEQELAADAAAAQLVGGQQSYLATLAAMALRQSEPPLAWPARTFLPTRGTFMRRIEMLRDDKLLTRKMTAGMRAGVIATLAAASLAVAGLRGAAADRKANVDRSDELTVADDSQPATERSKPLRINSGTSGSSASNGTSGSGSGQGTSDPLSLAWVPRDAIAVARIRPAELLNRPALAALKKAVLQQKDLQESLGVSLDKIEQATVIFLIDAGQPGRRPSEPAPAGIIVRLAEAGDAKALLNALQPNPEKQEYAGQTYFRPKEGSGQFCFPADERTVVVCGHEEHLRRLIVAGKNGASKALWAGAWRGADDSDIAALVNTAALGEMLNQAGAGGPPGGPVPAIAPLWQATTIALITADFSERLALSLTLTTQNAKDVQKVRDTLAAVVTLSKNALSQARGQFSRLPGGEGAALLGAADVADSLLDSLKIEVKDVQVQASASAEAEDAASLVAMLLPAIAQARVAARRSQATNNLKQLALAMHNYADVNGSFPPAVLYGPDGKTPYSWRVALLLYLEQAPLFQQYNVNQPWDSPDNKQVLAKMPPLFRDPNEAADSTFSSYFALTGPSTVFSGKEGSKFAQITDGTSNTLMFVEAKRDIPWTKPEDIPYDKDKPLPKLGGHYAEGFIAAFCDGSVRFISQNADPMLLRSIITRDGGELVDTSKLDSPIPQPRPAIPPGGATLPRPTPPKGGK